MIQGLPSSVMGWLAGRMVAGWMARGGFRLIYIDSDRFTFYFIDLIEISMIQGLPSSVMGWLAGRMVAVWLARRGFTWSFFDLHGFGRDFNDS